MELVPVFLTIIIGGLFYILPSVIAFSRNHHNALPICLVNLFMGWTILGWFISLIWSCCAVNTSTNIKSI